MKKLKTLLIDMDCILVDMLPYWVKTYNDLTGEHVRLEDLHTYELSNYCKKADLLYDILHTEGFFLPKNLPPMPGAVEYFQKLLDEGYQLIIVTQPPRKADFAIKEKREWIKHYFKNYDLTNMVFCHKKELIRGDLLFDDNPSHIEHWKKYNLDGVVTTINYPYNKEIKVDARFNSWKEFYEFVSGKL